MLLDKSYRILILIVILSLSCSCKAQTNQLEEDDFYSIAFNNITLGSIEETDANISQMQSLFGNSLNVRIPEDSPSLAKDFWNDDIIIGFQDDSDTGLEYYILYIKLLTPLFSVNVKGMTAKIGDSISVFEDKFVFNKNSVDADNSKYYWLTFLDATTGTSSLSFTVDKFTNIIKEIEYNTF